MEGVLNGMTWYIDPSPFPFLFFRSKNLTAEVAEHAEGGMAKGSSPGVQGGKERHWQRFPKGQYPQRESQTISALSASSSVKKLLAFILGGYR
jgi:hypothetical protein